ncbi:RICIN domain-containing protein [Polyangium sorediatum]|uniref:RICIN domain-containing protein n=1 Tax=Polyangium sorediatum TaxID=889274 RepID=A0ABT6P507_9BACT|nr:RICIN domain-containing protein [Polyangium sorediatum]MDI1435638.1 RICIN domain-containing protein [Polyangium sorediatum]
MTETTKKERPLSKKATERANKLREKLSGAREGSLGARRMQKNRAANPLFGAALHAAARLEAGHELSDLERTLVDALEKGISQEEIKAWGKAYRETKGARAREILPDVIADRPIDQPFTMRDLADALPAQVEAVKAQANVRVVDIAKLGPDQELDQRDEAFLAAAQEYGSSFVYFTSSAPQPEPAPTSAEGSGEALAAGEVFIIQPFKMRTIKRSGDTALGPSDEIFWCFSGGSDEDTWTFTSREFGSCDDGDWDERFDPSDCAFIGRVGDSLALTIDCWEKDAGTIFGNTSEYLRKAADHCLRACQELEGDPESKAEDWAALLYITFSLVAELLDLFNNEDDFVQGLRFGWDRAALLGLDNRELSFRFDGETERGMGIQDLYLRFKTIPTGRPVGIRSRNGQKAISIENEDTANGARVLQWFCDNTPPPHQQFRLEWKGWRYFQIVAVHSGKVLDVPGSSHNSEVPIIQYQSTGGYNQWFRLDPVGEGCVRIVAKHSGKVLDVHGGGIENGAVIQQHHWLGGNNQKWWISPV